MCFRSLASLQLWIGKRISCCIYSLWCQPCHGSRGRIWSCSKQAVQWQLNSKWQNITDFLPKLSLDFSWTVSTDSYCSWKAKKAQGWIWPANLQALPWPWESAEQQRWAENGKGWVSIYCKACGQRDCWLCTTKFQSSCWSLIWTITVWTKR